MAHQFEVDPTDPNLFQAALTMGERLVLARTARDVVELLGGTEDHDQDPDAEPQAPVLDQLLNLFDTPGNALPPQDPAVLALLPTASLDEEVAQEFRRFTENELRDAKVTRLLTLSRLLLEVPQHTEQDVHLPLLVPAAQAQAIAGALTDLRLVLAQRLGVESERDSNEVQDLATAVMSDEDQENMNDEEYRRHLLASLYLVTAYLLESLSECLLDHFRRNRPAGD